MVDAELCLQLGGSHTMRASSRCFDVGRGVFVPAAALTRATSPADTEPTNIGARLIDSAIVAARAPWRVKCSVFTNVTAAGRGSSRSRVGLSGRISLGELANRQRRMDRACRVLPPNRLPRR